MPAVNRHTVKEKTFSLTRLIKSNRDETFGIEYDLQPDELPIAKTTIDKLNWTVVTSRRIISCFNGHIAYFFATNVASWNWGFFKDKKKAYVVGTLETTDGVDFNFHIESGYASMININALKTLVGLVRV